jgi:hypothetical protein
MASELSRDVWSGAGGVVSSSVAPDEPPVTPEGPEVSAVAAVGARPEPGAALWPSAALMAVTVEVGAATGVSRSVC